MSSADFANLRLAESARGDRGTAEAHPAGVEGRILIERNRVAVGGDVGGLERRLRFLAANAFREHIRQQHMSVGAAGDDPESRFLQAFRQRSRVRQHLARVRHEFGSRGFAKADRLGRHHVHQRSSLHAGEKGLVDAGAVLSLSPESGRCGARAGSCAWWR